MLMTRMEDFAGKTAVVTGGASGIGYELAKRFVAEGMNVVIADIEQGRLEEAAAELGCHGVRTDVSDLASVQALAEEAVRMYGGVHVVCNNAGVGPFGYLRDLTMDDWKWMIDVNLWGVIHGVQTFLPLLRANEDGGWVINTASMGGLTTYPRLGAYATTKFGIVALTETLAAELAEEGSKVGATVLLPGPHTTNLEKSSRNRPEGNIGGLADVDLKNLTLYAKKLPYKHPSVCADVTIHAMRNGELYAVTHPEQFDRVADRLARLVKAFGKSASFNNL